MERYGTMGNKFLLAPNTKEVELCGIYVDSGGCYYVPHFIGKSVRDKTEQALPVPNGMFPDSDVLARDMSQPGEEEIVENKKRKGGKKPEI